MNHNVSLWPFSVCLGELDVLRPLVAGPSWLFVVFFLSVYLWWERVLVSHFKYISHLVTHCVNCFYLVFVLPDVQVGVSGPGSHVRRLHPHHEVSSTLKAFALAQWKVVCHSSVLHVRLMGRFNSRVQRYLNRQKKSSVNLANGLTGSTDLEDNVTCDATAVLLKKGKRRSPDSHWFWLRLFSRIGILQLY